MISCYVVNKRNTIPFLRFKIILWHDSSLLHLLIQPLVFILMFFISFVKHWTCRIFSEGEEMVITRLLFCGPHFPSSHYYTREYVQKYPFIKVDDVPFDDVPNIIGNYDICIVKSMRLDANVISRANRMKLIMQDGVGWKVLTSIALKHGIKVARIPWCNRNALHVEMAIYLTLGLLRKQNEMQIAVKQKKLGDPVGETLLGKTVFIMGFGNIGIQLAKRLQPFGVKILASKRSWDSYLQNSCKSDASLTQNGMNDDLVDEKGFHEDIHTFASNADIVICCLLMNSETAGIVNKTFISSMKKGVSWTILYHLNSGHLGGLGMDVAWTEPFDPEDPILKFPNALITPHVADVTEHAFRSTAKVVGNVALQLHAGSPLTRIEFVN
ncbi:D-3-phosphoglycerate dehydrogenase [Camellia lanceoleosa]|uniref:D-3-phosphoglycerate dehydrogenase n=1 Tax=Camellia lanceoleosa TaxID=1840588 RepID=A0ACC0FJD9_9ERIC|nr:D-3-phosphoglycerate dehydrogenase [Camellia lanceoleosa]